MTRTFFFDPATLAAMGERHGPSFVGARPFPHVVIDDFLPAEVADRVLGEFPPPSDPAWRSFTHQHSEKQACAEEDKLGEFTRHVISQLNSSVFVRFLEQLTGIGGLIPDAHLVGGGLHRIGPGGFLDVHADFNYHPDWHLDRRLNLLLYLNRDWKDEYGGHLELWDRTMKSCEKRILPVFNRMVLFSTTDFSYHGHPQPLSCPAGTARKSLALYYYSNGRPAEEASPVHSTLYRSRAGQTAGAEAKAAGRPAWRTLALKVTPPIFVDLLRSVQGGPKGR